MALQPMAIRRAARSVTPDNLRLLEELHKRVLVETNPATRVQFNRDYRMSIYEAAVSPRVAAIIRSLKDASVMYVGVALGAPGLLSEANEGHEAILAAVA